MKLGLYMLFTFCTCNPILYRLYLPCLYIKFIKHAVFWEIHTFSFYSGWFTRDHSDQTDSINSPRTNYFEIHVLQGKKWLLKNTTVGEIVSRKKIRLISSLEGWFRLLKRIGFSGFTNYFKYQVSAGSKLMKSSKVLQATGENVPYR